MKKIIVAVMALGLVGTVTALDSNETNTNEKMEVVKSGGSYKILNDTGEKVRIHTGYGETTLNPKGGSTSVTCAPGKKVKIDGKVIFEVTSDMCGETVRLSDYL